MSDYELAAQIALAYLSAPKTDSIESFVRVCLEIHRKILAELEQLNTRPRLFFLTRQETNQTPSRRVSFFLHPKISLLLSLPPIFLNRL